MSDFELEAEIVPDKSAIESIQDGEVELSTDGAVGEQTDIQEQQSEQLSVIGRSLGRVLSVLKQVSVIAGILAVISKILGSAFDIGFEDVRDAIVNALDEIVDPIKSGLGFGGKSFAEKTETERAMTPGPLGFASLAPDFFGLPSAPDNSNSNSASGQDFNVSLLTSRDALMGDSTQKDMQSDNVHFQILEGGS